MKSKWSKVALLYTNGQREFIDYAVSNDNCVYVLMCDHGCATGIPDAVEEAKRLEAEFGEDRVVFAGVQNISSALYNFLYELNYHTIRESASKCPFLKPACLCCMSCIVAAFVELIAFCKANEIKTAVMNKREGLLSELPELATVLVAIAEGYGITLEFIECYGNKVHGLQCLFCTDPVGTLKEAHRQSLMTYYKEYMYPLIVKRVSKRIKEVAAAKTTIQAEPMHL